MAQFVKQKLKDHTSSPIRDYIGNRIAESHENHLDTLKMMAMKHFSNNLNNLNLSKTDWSSSVIAIYIRENDFALSFMIPILRELRHEKSEIGLTNGVCETAAIHDRNLIVLDFFSISPAHCDSFVDCTLQIFD